MDKSVLASRSGALLLIDEPRGRRAAKAAGVEVVGTGALLVAAKTKGVICEVTSILQELLSADYRLSPELVRCIRDLAGES